MNSFNFQIVTVANLAAITTPFPDHICYFTEDTENYYIWENGALKEIFVDASSITWNNITNKPTTITGYGITDAVKVNSGTLNYVAKFTPDGTTIGNSQIVDDGNEIYVGASYGAKFNIETSTSNIGILASAFKVSGLTIGISGNATQSGGNGTNTGVYGNAGYSDGSNIGVHGSSATSGGGYNVGVFAYASGGIINHAIQITDQTSMVAGRYLRNMTNDGKASWANINITEVTNGLSSTLLGAPNGIATLDNSSKLVMSQMPISVMDYKGTYDIVTNTPNLVDGTGNQGDVYVCTTAGTRTFGVGNTLTVSVGDWLIYNGTKWEKTLGNNVGSGTVSSVGLSLGTTGNDVNISNSPITSSGNINLNIPTASATARGVLSTADWTKFNNKISGSGQLNQVARWTPDGATLGYGVIQDNGSTVGIGTPPSINTNLSISTSSNYCTTDIRNYFNGNNGALYVLSGGVGSGSNYGGSFVTLGSTTLNVGLFSTAQHPTVGENIGIYASAINSSTANYAIQLQDPSSLAGRFLKSITNNGKANWANITAADVSGAVGAVNGTDNYVAKFTPNGTTIGISLIQDNGTAVGVNITPNANAMFFVKGGSQSNAIAAQSNVNNGTAIYGQAFTGTGTLYGVTGYANSSTSTNNIGLYGKAVNAASNYPIQLEESISSTGKFLKSITGDGKANWAYLPDSAQLMCSDMTTPITASTALAKSFWIAPCNGQLTDIFANLYSPQAGGAAFSVSIKMNGTTIASPSFTAGAQQSSIIVTPNTFTKGTLFEVFVIQVGDGSAKGLLATINYLRT